MLSQLSPQWLGDMMYGLQIAGTSEPEECSAKQVV